MEANSCPGCQVLLQRVAELEAQVQGLTRLLEEQQRAIGFVMSHAAARAIDYDGESPAGFHPSEDA